MNPADHAAMLRQTAALMEEAARAVERVEELEKTLANCQSGNRTLSDRNEALKQEIVTIGNHAACRLNVLGDIYRVLGSDGGETGANALTGVSPELDRLPKRIERLIRENETLARNVPPEPPPETGEKQNHVYVGQTWCRSGRTAPDDGVVLNYPDGWVVLCESWADLETGELTYVPVPVRELPKFRVPRVST